jgi:hypothetical protein
MSIRGWDGPTPKRRWPDYMNLMSEDCQREVAGFDAGPRWGTKRWCRPAMRIHISLFMKLRLSEAFSDSALAGTRHSMLAPKSSSIAYVFNRSGGSRSGPLLSAFRHHYSMLAPKSSAELNSILRLQPKWVAKQPTLLSAFRHHLPGTIQCWRLNQAPSSILFYVFNRSGGSRSGPPRSCKSYGKSPSKGKSENLEPIENNSAQRNSLMTG